MRSSGWGGDSETHSYGTTAGDDSSIGRWECLKLVGVAAASTAGIAAGSDVARAASGGYADGGYGEGAYGGGGFGVSTGDATGVDATSATLEGELSDPDGADSADCYFEWRRIGASNWTATTARSLTATGAFSASPNGLEDGVEYEYRAVGSASDGDTDTGATTSFTTDSGRTAPSVDSCSVTEAGSPSPHAEITADWRVADADGDLDTVTVEVSGTSGRVLDTATTGVGGGSASGTDTFKI